MIHATSTFRRFLSSFKGAGCIAQASQIVVKHCTQFFSCLFYSRDLFLGEGLDYLTVILNERCFDAALRIIANVTPMFFGCHEKLTQEARY